MKRSIANVIFFIGSFVLFTYMTCERDTYPSSSNPGNYSLATGVKYNTDNSLEVKAFDNIVTCSGVYMEGGSIALSNDFHGGDLFKPAPATAAKNVTVTSMVVDRTPVCNIHWIEMVTWLRKLGPKDFYKKLEPLKDVWKKEFAYNDPIVRQYFSHPTFWFHPVVGISWVQAMFYCWWRTLRTNLDIIEKMDEYDLYKDFGRYTLAEIADFDLAEIKDHDISKFANLKLSQVAPKNVEIEEEDEEDQEDEEFDEEEFDEEDEEGEQEQEQEQEPKNHLEKIKKQGLLLCSRLRLPIGAEYLYYIGGAVQKKMDGGAAPNIDKKNTHYALNTKDYYDGIKKNTSDSGYSDSKNGVIVRNQKPTPWNSVRFRDSRGRIAANFKQGPGEYSDYGITSYVYKYLPNSHGIFCFVGVSEFIQGVYREIPAETLGDLSPLRRNDKRDSSRYYRNFNPLITNKTRTYIGPNYKDTMSTSLYIRRPLLETEKRSYIGFRCVQTVIKTAKPEH